MQETVPIRNMSYPDTLPMASDSERSRMLSPDHELLRMVEGLTGEVELRVSCRPRPVFGTQAAHLRSAGKLGFRIEGRHQTTLLRSTAPLEIRPGAIEGVFRLRAGERACFSLVYNEEAPAVLPPLEPWCCECLDRTVSWWRSWSTNARASEAWDAMCRYSKSEFARREEAFRRARV